MPLKQEIECSRPHVSTYQLDFSKNGVKQMLVKRPKTSFEGTPTTTYRYAHCDVAPYREEINNLSRKAVQLTTISRIERAKTAKPACRDTVASCLSWYRPKVPAATAVTDFSLMLHVPAPPASAPAPAPPAAQQAEALPSLPTQVAAAAD